MEETVPSPPHTTMQSAPSASAARTIRDDSSREAGKYQARSSAASFHSFENASSTRWNREAPGPERRL